MNNHKNNIKSERVWRILNVVCKAISAFTESLCCYFDDSENSEPHPKELKVAVGKAEEIINGLVQSKKNSRSRPAKAGFFPRKAQTAPPDA